MDYKLSVTLIQPAQNSSLALPMMLNNSLILVYLALPSWLFFFISLIRYVLPDSGFSVSKTHYGSYAAILLHVKLYLQLCQD